MKNTHIENIPAYKLRAGDIVALRVDQVCHNNDTNKIELIDVESGPLLPDQIVWRVLAKK